MLAGVDERLARLRPADLVDVRVEFVQRAVLLEKLDRRLLADARHAGDVVRAVAGERLEVDELLRRQAVALLDLLQPVSRRHRIGPARRVENLHLLVDQLEHIAVAGHDEHVVPFAAGLVGQRAEDIVGLVVSVGENRDVERAQHGFDARHLRAHVVGHGVARRLVFGEFGVAPGVPGVKGHGHVIGLDLAQRGEQFARKAVDGRGWLALARRERCLHAEICAVRLGMTVNQ